MDKVAVSRAVAALLAAAGCDAPRPRPTVAVRTSQLTPAGDAGLRAGRADGARIRAQSDGAAVDADRATLDRILRVLLGRAVELGPRKRNDAGACIIARRR